MRWSRRTRDARVTEMLAGMPGERLLGWGELVDGSVAVATDRALHAPGVEPIPWERVTRAAWNDGFLDVDVDVDVDVEAGDDVTAAPGSTAPPAALRLRFEEPGTLPVVVRERVEWTIVASRPVSLAHPDGRAGSARVTARRSPAGGPVRWSVAFAPGVDPDDPGWRGAGDAALAALRANLGV